VISLLLAVAVGSPVAAAQPPTIPAKIYAQQLVDETVAEHPELLVVAMHVTPPKGSDNVIIASNVGRIGAKATPNDLRVIRTGGTKLAVDGGRRFHAELALRDTSGANVGALDLEFPYHRGDEQAALRQQAELIRDDLARRILNVANLFDPYPVDPAAPTKTHAQKLVDEAMASHAELLSLAMHVTLPNSAENIILGSSFGRIGKKADEDDRKVIETGRPAPGIFAAGTRFGVELALQDASRRTIGALAVAYAYKNGDDQRALLERAERLRDEIGVHIASVEQLVELDP
jgi:hypothetical protein